MYINMETLGTNKIGYIIQMSTCTNIKLHAASPRLNNAKHWIYEG